MIGRLPTSLTVNEKSYNIRTDFRDILKILLAFADEDLEPKEKAFVLMAQIYKDLAELPKADYEQAYLQAMAFVSCETVERLQRQTKKNLRLIDWEKDEMLLFPAVNKVAGFEVRTVDYMHWWTFMGFFQGIDREDTYGFILSIRQKRAKHKKLEKYEQSFFNANREICDLNFKTRQDAEDELVKIFNELANKQ